MALKLTATNGFSQFSRQAQNNKSHNNARSISKNRTSHQFSALTPKSRHKNRRVHPKLENHKYKLMTSAFS
jgi:hypothetical protein